MAVAPSFGATLACLQATAQLTALLGTVLVACIVHAACTAPGLSRQRQEEGSRPRVAAPSAPVRTGSKRAPQTPQDATCMSRTDTEDAAAGSAAAEPSSKPSSGRQRNQSGKATDEAAALSKKRRSKEENRQEGKKKRRAADAAGAAAASTPRAAESPASVAPCADEERIRRKRQKQRDRQQQQQQQQRGQQQQQAVPGPDPGHRTSGDPAPGLRGQLPDAGPAASGHHTGGQLPGEGPAASGAGVDVPGATTDTGPARRPIYSYWSAEDVARLVACVEDAEYRRLHLGSEELDWRQVAAHLGRSAQSVYCKYRHQRITVAQPKAPRVRRAVSYTWMAIFGMASLPDCTGTGDDICAAVEAHPPFQPFLDRSFRRDSSGVPNWQQRIKEELSHKPYFHNTGTKRDGQAVWRLDVEHFNDSAPKRLKKSIVELNLPGAPFLGKNGKSNA